MTDWFDHLSAALAGADAKTHTMHAGNGRLLVLPHAARLLACELADIPGLDANLFWHSTVIEDPNTARACLAAAGGGLGGDRLWVAPEVAYMWPDLQRARTDPAGGYQLPPQMDPADYHVIEQFNAHIRLATRMTLTDGRVAKRITITLRRGFDAINPPVGLPAGLKTVSFSIRNELTLVEGDDGAVAGTWDLLQIPPGGTVICPTTTPVPTPRSYYDPFGDRHVYTDDRCVRVRIDGRRKIKMGLAPMETTGRMGYYRRCGDASTLIVRIFSTQPGEPYVDLPRDSSERFGGDALQVYNDGGAYGGFGEMEYHDPALVVGQTPATRTGVSVTHVLAGSDRAVHNAGRILLGVEIEPIE